MTRRGRLKGGGNLDDKANVVIVGLICVTVLIALAIYKGINGVILTTGVGVISTILGIYFGIRVEAKKAVTRPKES